jgi:hypothetical protein
LLVGRSSRSPRSVSSRRIQFRNAPGCTPSWSAAGGSPASDRLPATTHRTSPQLVRILLRCRHERLLSSPSDHDQSPPRNRGSSIDCQRPRPLTSDCRQACHVVPLVQGMSRFSAYGHGQSCCRVNGARNKSTVDRPLSTGREGAHLCASECCSPVA